MRYKFPATGDQATDDLGRQYEKIVKTWNRGSIGTRYRYADAGARFIKWLSRTYKTQKLSNLADKHIIAYGRHLKLSGKTDKYIKNEVSALQYLHAYIPHTRYGISNSADINKEIGLGPTPNYRASDLDQTWNREELERFCRFADEKCRSELARMAEITYHTGCRLEEVATLRRHEVEAALRIGQIYLTNTKGGRPRFIPLTKESRIMLESAISKIPRGGYVFVPHYMTVHSFIQSVKDFIYRYRKEFQDPSRVGDEGRTELHWHGLRHSYAQNTYFECRDEGCTDEEARGEVSERLGHSRKSVTKVYVK